MATTFMNLTLPTVSTTLGPLWATEINAAITSIDSHDHSSGNGNPVPVAGMVIDANLAYGDYGITGLGSTSFTSLAALLTSINTVYVKDGDLYSNDGAGNQVRITAGGTLNVGTIGGIGGDYGTTSATAFYTDASTTYFFQDSASAAADFNIGAIACTDVTPSGNVNITGTLGVTGVSTVGTLAATTVSTGALSSAITGYGLVKPGMMIAIASNLTGSHAVPSTGTVDSSGYILCDGAAIPGSQTVSGTTPDLSDNRFLMGAATAGTAAGANTYNLQHSHTVNSHTHTGPNHTHSTPSHTHSTPNHTHTLTGGAHIQKSSNDLQMETTTGLASWTSNTEVDAVSTTNSPASWTTGIKISGSANSGGGSTTGSSSGTSGAAGTGATGSSAPGTNNGGSATQNILPQYVTCQYLMRVK